jgi:hypothetical protein
MPRLLLLTLLFVLALGCNPVQASGQAFCRIETPFSLRCAVEQSIFKLEFFEVLTGVSLRYQTEFSAGAYTALLFRFNPVWLELDIAASSAQGFGFAIAGGFAW